MDHANLPGANASGSGPKSGLPGPRSRSRWRRLFRTLNVFSLVILGLIGLVALEITQPALRKPASVALAASADGDQLRDHVVALSRRFTPRDQDHPENLDRAAVYIRSCFAQAGLSSESQRFSVAGMAYQNIIATVGGQGSERIVVGAHYDAYGELPGADDNASGVAGLLELARILAAEPPPMRIELVAYTLEEPPYFRTRHMGSMVHAQSLKQKGVPIRAMMSLEMIGYFTDARKSQEYPHPLLNLLYPSTGNFIAIAGRFGEERLVRTVKAAMGAATDLPVRSINAPAALPGIDFSDHLSYWKAGYPAVMITDTAFYRNANYHTSRDTPETLDYARLAKAVDGVAAAVLVLSK